MNKLPNWMQSRLSGDKKQVSHGLNLALKLKEPIKLPLLLLDIVLAKPKIDRALTELSFIHFARLVPSWDGRALMVTTEFDGPLEPYVMDFVIALGDVFDTLLSYVEDPPPLPIREHPDQFWAYVQQWNRVPFFPRSVLGDAALLPADFDYPVFSAYPEKTVTDIARSWPKLLPPAIDHPGAHVDLDDVQGNILYGYRAKKAAHLFFTIQNHVTARIWLSNAFASSTVDSHPWRGVTSAARWGEVDGVTIKPDLMGNVAFTFVGLEMLLPERISDLQRFPIAFREGAEARSAENGDLGPSDPANWKFGRGAQEIHVVLSLYEQDTPQTERKSHKPDSPSLFDTALEALLGDASSSGLALVGSHRAEVLPNGEVPFGYRDGISKPRISGQGKPDDLDFQPAASPGEFILGKDYADIFGGRSLGDLPGDLAQNGTFGVLRLMEQDVELFDRTIALEAARLGIADDLLKAKLLGRWPDGRPLSLDPNVTNGDSALNDFDYAPSWERPTVFDDADGLRCPIGAHIRRANPRTGRVAGQRHSRRLIRRGMPTSWDEDGSRKVGLLGLFFGGSIERQFEFIQQQWVQGDIAASGIRGQQDPIAGLRSKPMCHQVPGAGDVDLPPLVCTRGCLYLFFPGIAAIKGLRQPGIASQRGGSDGLLQSFGRMAGSLANSATSRTVDLIGLDAIPPTLRKFLDDLLSMNLESEAVGDLIAHFAPEASDTCGPSDEKPSGEIRPLDPRFVANPYPAYATLRRAHASTVWVKEHRAYWVLERGDAQRLFDEPELFKQARSDNTLRGIITLDDPRHHTVRAAVVEAFGNATANLDSYIDDSINQALDYLKKLEQFDLITHYAAVVPSRVFWRVFGVPVEERAEFEALAQTMMRHYGQPQHPGAVDALIFANAAVRLTALLGFHLGKAWTESLVGLPHVRGTLIGEIASRTHVRTALGEFPPSRPIEFMESLLTLVQLVLAGYMSSQFLIGTAMRNLLMPDPRADRPGQQPWMELGRIRTESGGDFERVFRAAIDEARRVDPPVTIVERHAAVKTIIGGVDVPADCRVCAVVGSSNRDLPGERDPEEFHWDRTPATANLSLGHGIHECIGKSFQENLVPKALNRLMEQMPSLRICDPTAVPAWFDNIYFRALQSLPVTRCK